MGREPTADVGLATGCESDKHGTLYAGLRLTAAKLLNHRNSDFIALQRMQNMAVFLGFRLIFVRGARQLSRRKSNKFFANAREPKGEPGLLKKLHVGRFRLIWAVKSPRSSPWLHIVYLKVLRVLIATITLLKILWFPMFLKLFR